MLLGSLARAVHAVARGGKSLIGKALGLLRRDEVMLAVRLVPVPVIDKIVLLVRALDQRNLSGQEKMAEALVKLEALLETSGIRYKESDLRFLIELALKLKDRKARIV